MCTVTCKSFFDAKMTIIYDVVISTSLVQSHAREDLRKVRFPTRPDLANSTFPSCPASFSIDASKVWGGAWPWATRARRSREYARSDASCCTTSLLKSCKAIRVGGLENVRTRRNPAANYVRAARSATIYNLLESPRRVTKMPVEHPAARNLFPPLAVKVGMRKRKSRGGNGYLQNGTALVTFPENRAPEL